MIHYACDHEQSPANQKSRHGMQEVIGSNPLTYASEFPDYCPLLYLEADANQKFESRRENSNDRRKLLT